MIAIRPFAFTDSDYEAAVHIVRIVYPDLPDSVQEWKHSDRTRDPNFLYERHLVELEGRIVATGIYCEPWWSYITGKYFLNLIVHPDYQNRGIGAQFYDFLIGHVLVRDPLTVTAEAREDNAAALHFLAKRGYHVVQREPISVLEVAEFDVTPFEHIPPKVAADGIIIKSLEEVSAAEPEWKRKLWQLEALLFEDVPSSDPITIDPFEIFVERELGSPNFRLDGHFIACDGDHWVGMTALWPSEVDSGMLYTGLTGVRREYRRRGIATALKLRAIDYARRRGAKTIETGNDEDNPMFRLNLELGFRPRPAWLAFEKRFKQPG